MSDRCLFRSILATLWIVRCCRPKSKNSRTRNPDNSILKTHIQELLMGSGNKRSIYSEYFNVFILVEDRCRSHSGYLVKVVRLSLVKECTVRSSSIMEDGSTRIGRETYFGSWKLFQTTTLYYFGSTRVGETRLCFTSSK